MVAGKSEYRERTRYVQDGNTVRVIRADAEPSRERELERRRRVHEKQHGKQESVPQGLTIAFPVLILLIGVVTVSLYLGYSYLSLKSSVDRHLENVKVLETRLEALKTENDALEQSIDTSVDLNYVYQVAVGKLGMVYAGQDNVIRYDKTESQYVRQYEQIPEF